MFEDLSKEEKDKLYSQAAYILRDLREVGVTWAGNSSVTKEDFVLAAEDPDILEDTARYLWNNVLKGGKE